MERKLKALFDYQKFEGNPALREVIDSTHSRYAVQELSMDEMELVAAAGVPQNPAQKKSGKHNPDAIC